MFRFKVLSGKHYDLEGNTFILGDIIEDEKKLDEIFKNKFEFIGKVEKAQVEPKPEPKPEVDAEEKAHVKPQRNRRNHEREPKAF